MKGMRIGIVTVFMAALACAPGLVFAGLFSEDFEVDPSASWTVNNGPSDEAHSFFFDYSTVGIPAAPSGAGMHGRKLQANLTNGIFGGRSVSPTGQDFTGKYTVRFDLWSNFNGPFPGGGSGSTNLSTYGVMTAGTSAQWPGVADSVWFANTGDGGSAADWRAYSPDAPTSYLSGNPVYAAPTLNASDAYYAGFGGVAAPAAQLALFPQQTGSTNVGTGGMAWHQVVIDVNNDIVTWTVDGLLLATVDASGMLLGGGNIFFGHSDVNATSSTDPNDAALLFTLIDNIQVEAIPEPATLALVGLAGLLLFARRRRA
jgi:hypothetical protein